jgi:hypothetical protein
VDCTKKAGNSSFTVNTVPRHWDWSSEERVSDSYQALIDMAGKAGETGLRARLVQEREQTLTELRKARSSHHALVVDATARGEGFLRSGGCLELTVTAELVFVGTDETLGRALARHRASLGK